MEGPAGIAHWPHMADASGLLYMNGRYYNPATARFLSQDTYTGSASDPWTQHLYAYCNNNPVNMVDPTGHSALLIALLVAITTTVLASTGCGPESQYNCTAYAYGLDENSEYANRTLTPGDIGSMSGKGSGGRHLLQRSLKDPTVSDDEKRRTVMLLISGDVAALNMYCAPAVMTTDENGVIYPEVAEGNWAIAFAYNLNDESQFHFWRLDGTEWTHKPGGKPIRNVDEDGIVIGKDLEGANRGQYNSQLYYFEIGPNLPLYATKGN